jgi:membrane-bound ClpP family serine protease
MILYYQFNFTLMDANTTLIFGSDVIAIVPESLSVAPQRDAIYNFSGHIVETQVDDIPEGYFVVEQINTEVQVDWVDAIFQFISICASIVGLIANAISVFFFTYTGFQIPPLLVTIIIILLALYSVIKHWKAIGIILGIICIVLVVSGVFNILRLAWLSV